MSTAVSDVGTTTNSRGTYTWPAARGMERGAIAYAVEFEDAERHSAPSADLPTKRGSEWRPPRFAPSAAVQSAVQAVQERAKEYVRSEVRVSGLDKWDGRVVEVGDAFITAELLPHIGSTVVHADFPRDLLDGDVEIGDVIYVTSRTVQDAIGRPYRTTAVRLARVGYWTAEDVASHWERGAEAYAEFANYTD